MIWQLKIHGRRDCLCTVGEQYLRRRGPGVSTICFLRRTRDEGSSDEHEDLQEAIEGHFNPLRSESRRDREPANSVAAPPCKTYTPYTRTGAYSLKDGATQRFFPRTRVTSGATFDPEGLNSGNRRTDEAN